MSDFRIQSLDAKYVGPFEHLFIEFKEKPEAQKDEAEVHIFTGENGTGKSTVLYLLTAYPNSQIIRPRVQAGQLKNFRVESQYQFSSDPQLLAAKTAKIVISGAEESGNFFGLVIDNDKLLPYFKASQEGGEHKYNFSLFAYSGYRRIDNPKLQSIKEIDEHPLNNALNFSYSTNAQHLLQWIANTISREALVFRTGQEKEATKYKLSLIKLQDAIAQIVDGTIEFVLPPKEFNVFVIWNGLQTTFEVLPDGLKSIISWLGDLLMRLDRIEWETEMDIFDRNFILFLDEIDIHLHPAWQRKILPVVKKLFKNAQIFISTHSPFVIGSVDGAWVYKLKKDGQYSVLDGEPVLSEDAKSYQTIFEETFGIKENFGEAVEKKLKEFSLLRNEILVNEREITDDTFQNLIRELAGQSIELESILSMELRQLERIKKSKQLQASV